MCDEYDFSKGKRGPAIESPGKTRITIMLGNDIIEVFRKRAESAIRPRSMRCFGKRLMMRVFL